MDIYEFNQTSQYPAPVAEEVEDETNEDENEEDVISATSALRQQQQNIPAPAAGVQQPPQPVVQVTTGKQQQAGAQQQPPNPPFQLSVELRDWVRNQLIYPPTTIEGTPEVVRNYVDDTRRNLLQYVTQRKAQRAIRGQYHTTARALRDAGQPIPDDLAARWRTAKAAGEAAHAQITTLITANMTNREALAAFSRSSQNGNSQTTATQNPPASQQQ